MSAKESSEFTETQDMGISVALICRGFELLDLRSEGTSKRVVFIFRNSNGIEEAIQDYWSGKLRVDAKLYWNETKNLKTRLYSQG